MRNLVVDTRSGLLFLSLQLLCSCGHDRRVLLEYTPGTCVGAVRATCIVRGPSGSADLQIAVGLEPAADSCVIGPLVIDQVPPASGRRLEVLGHDSAGDVVFSGVSRDYSDPGSDPIVVRLLRQLPKGTALFTVNDSIRAPKDVKWIEVGTRLADVNNSRVRVGSVEERSYQGTEANIICVAVSGLPEGKALYGWAFNAAGDQLGVACDLGTLASGEIFAHSTKPVSTCTVLVPGKPSRCQGMAALPTR